MAIAADSAAEITASSNATNDMGAPMVDTGLCVLPTKRYTLAPSRPRTADDMQFVAKVADFGKSCLLGPEGVTKAGGYATLTHMAPEVLTDQTLSPAADVYAVGVLLWQVRIASVLWFAQSLHERGVWVGTNVIYTSCIFASMCERLQLLLIRSSGTMRPSVHTGRPYEWPACARGPWVLVCGGMCVSWCRVCVHRCSLAPVPGQVSTTVKSSQP